MNLFQRFANIRLILSKKPDYFVAAGLWIIISLGYLVLSWSKSVYTSREAALMWWNSVDDAIPELTAKWMISFGTFLDGWSPFDRGPLQPLILIVTGSIWMGPEASYVVGVIINCFWVFGLYLLLRAVNISPSKAITTSFAVSLVGPVWINTVYPWPKLLGAGLTLMAFTMLIKSRLAWSIFFISLALLAHGSSLFAFVALVILAILKFRNFKFAYYSIALVPAFIWNLGGSIFPQFGDLRLTQWHFAGTDITEIDSRNPFISIIYEYSQSGWSIIQYKWNNLLATFGFINGEVASGTTSWWDESMVDFLRAKQMMSVLLAPGVLLLGVIRATRTPTILWIFTGVLWACYVLMEWGGNIFSQSWLHTSPLSLLVMFSAALSLAFKWWLVIPVQLIYFTVMWYQAMPVSL